MAIEVSWLAEAKELGFETEAQMLSHLYDEQGFTISQIAKIVGYSTFAVRRRLTQLGVTFRARGGSGPRLGKRLLAALSDDQLFKSKVTDICDLHGVSPATVWSERKFRKGKVNDELLRDSSFGLDAPGRGPGVAHGSGPTPGGSEIYELLPSPPKPGEEGDPGQRSVRGDDGDASSTPGEGGGSAADGTGGAGLPE